MCEFDVITYAQSQAHSSSTHVCWIVNLFFENWIAVRIMVVTMTEVAENSLGVN